MEKRTSQLVRVSMVLWFFVLIAFSHSPAFAQDPIVTLKNGRKVILHSNKTWDYYKGISYNFDFSSLTDNHIPTFLRQGISVDKHTLIVAVEMYLQGWRYTMPNPKSSQASWGNYDGRTTWWKGYWHNQKTNKYSSTTPHKKADGYYCGDAQNNSGYWRNGGSPGTPTKIEWLLSDYGGVRP